MRNPFFFFFFSDGARQLAHHRWIVSAHGRTKGAGFILWIQWYANKLWEICANIFPFKIQGFVYDSLGHIYLPVPNLQCVFYYIHRRSKDYPTWSWFTGFLVIHRKRQVMTFQPYGITQCVCECVCVCWVSGDPCKGSELECSHCWRPARTLPELAQTHTDKALHVELMYRTCQPGYTISALHNDVWAFQARCRLFIPQNGDSPRREGK